MSCQNNICKSIFKNQTTEPDVKAYTEIWIKLIEQALSDRHAPVYKETKE